MGSGVGFDVKRTEAVVLLSHAFSCEFEAVSVVDQTVENGVGEGRICDRLVPVLDGKLAGCDGGAAAVTVVRCHPTALPAGEGVGCLGQLPEVRPTGSFTAPTSSTSKAEAIGFAISKRR